MENNKYWNRLLQRGFQSCFKELFDKLGIRATKAMVGSELTIPRQTRWVVPVNLGLVEKRVRTYACECISRRSLTHPMLPDL
jgi:E3 ubiquitin-protein ligase SHPRH